MQALQGGHVRLPAIVLRLQFGPRAIQVLDRPAMNAVSELTSELFFVVCAHVEVHCSALE